MTRADKQMTIALALQCLLFVLMISSIFYLFQQQNDTLAHNHLNGIHIHTLDCRIAMKLGVDLKGTDCP